MAGDNGRMAKWNKELTLAGIILLVSSLSFSLGYLANREAGRAPIIIEKCSK
jgi:hypothetical protein